MELLRLLHAAERETGGAPRLVGGHSAAPVLVLEKSKVRCQLAGEIRVRAVADGIQQAKKKPPHHDPPSFNNSLSTSPASRRQRAVCFSSARAPARVML